MIWDENPSYLVKVRRDPDGGWYFKCPEHHKYPVGPYDFWWMAYEIAVLHLRNSNHF